MSSASASAAAAASPLSTLQGKLSELHPELLLSHVFAPNGQAMIRVEDCETVARNLAKATGEWWQVGGGGVNDTSIVIQAVSGGGGDGGEERPAAALEARIMSPRGGVLYEQRHTNAATIEDFKEDFAALLRRMRTFAPCCGQAEDFLMTNFAIINKSDLVLMLIEKVGEEVVLRSRDCQFYISDEERNGGEAPALVKKNERRQCAECQEFFLRLLESPYENDDEAFDEENFSSEQKEVADAAMMPEVVIKTERNSGDEGDAHAAFIKQENHSFAYNTADNLQRLKSHPKIVNRKNREDKMKRERSGPSVSCKICDLHFNYKKNYRKHMLQKHQVEVLHLDPNVPTYCNLCDRHLPDGHDLRQHGELVHGLDPELIRKKKRHTCTVDSCGKMFSFVKGLNNHLRRAHGHAIEFDEEDAPNDKTNQRCAFCPRIFVSKGRLATHYSSAHGSEDLAPHAAFIKRQRDKKRGLPVVCDECGVEVSCQSALRGHKLNRHSESTEECPCPICGKFFKKQHLKNHMIIHNPKTHLCTHCGLSFTTKHYLNVHLQTHDIDYRCIPCTMCEKTFGRVQALNRHMKSEHLNQRDFICITCGKSFVCQSKLTRHTVIHSGTKNFPCELCPYKCVRLDNLNLHRRKSHGVSTPTSRAEVYQRLVSLMPPREASSLVSSELVRRPRPAEWARENRNDHVVSPNMATTKLL